MPLDTATIGATTNQPAAVNKSERPLNLALLPRKPSLWERDADRLAREGTAEGNASLAHLAITFSHRHTTFSSTTTLFLRIISTTAFFLQLVRTLVL